MLRTIQYIWNHPLARHGRTHSLTRYFCWQLASRLIKCPIVLPFVDKTVLVTETSMTGATGNYYCGLHEFADMGFLLHFLRRGDFFLDVGANVGSYSVLASGVVGASTLAFEPVPNTFAKLVRNIRINNIEGLVSTERMAVGRSEGEIRFSTDRDTVNAVVDSHYEGESESVPISSLDLLLKGKQPILWKVDVEGFELEVLQGAAEALRNKSLQAILLEGQTDEINSIVLDAGFSKAFYDPFSRRLTTVKSDEKLKQQNQLWVRDAAFVQTRCAESIKYKINNVSF